jgi:hypothetical protein
VYRCGKNHLGLNRLACGLFLSYFVINYSL